MKSDRNISISEFAEDILGVKLMVYQKDFLEKLYEVYKKDSNKFKSDRILIDMANSQSNITYEIFKRYIEEE